MIVVDSCGWLEWFTDGKLAMADAIIAAVSLANNRPIYFPHGAGFDTDDQSDRHLAKRYGLLY